MSTCKRGLATKPHRIILVLIGLTLCWPVAGFSVSPNLGREVNAEEIRRWNLNVFPDGRGLPAGSGSVAEGALVYESRCQSCHGPKGQGASADELAGKRHPLTDVNPDKTIGNFWPYATTLFDFVRRSMPLDKPGSLTDNELYAVTAYLLNLNEVIEAKATLDAATLPKVVMPNREGFVRIDAQ